LLLDAARALNVPERASIERYAAASARAALAQPHAAGEETALYALLTLQRLGEASPDPRALPPPGPLGLAALYTRDPTLDEPLAPSAAELSAGLRRIGAFRNILRARGTSPLTAAALSSQALTALALGSPGADQLVPD